MTMANHDPAMIKSNYARNDKDRYWTDPWVTRCLLDVAPSHWGAMQGRVWEPAAGRGDLAGVLIGAGLEVFASDVDLSEFDTDLCEHELIDFLDQTEAPRNVSAVITNPPYDRAHDFVKHALSFWEVDVVAMFLRAEWNHAKTRRELFEREDFAFEIVLTTRPRWDWHLPEEEIAKRKMEGSYHGPRHNYSWFVWDRRWEGNSTQYWRGSKDVA
jgi:hypothetical protein